MPDNISGASYILTTHRGNTLYFGINGSQAINASGRTLWRFWLGSPGEESVHKRHQQIMSYLQGCGMKPGDGLLQWFFPIKRAANIKVK